MVKGDLVTQVSSWCNVFFFFFKFLIKIAVSLSWHQNQNLAMNLSSSNGFWDINLKLKNNLVETQICFVFSRKMHVKWLPKREYQFHNVLIIGAYLKDHLATPFVRLRKPFRHKGMLDNNRFGLKRKEHMF